MREDINEFMNPTLTALQTPKLEGGLSNTPEKAAQIAALMQGTPIEKIKAASELVRTAGARGTAANLPVPPSGTARTSRVTHTDMPRQVIPGAEQTGSQATMPIPGMETGDFSATTQATNPSMFSTILAYQDMNKPVEPAPEIKAPSDETKKPGSVLDTLKFITQHFTPAGMIYNQDATPLRAATEGIRASIESGPEDVQKLWDMARGGTAGLAQMPVNMLTGPLVTGLGAAGIMLDEPALKRGAFNVAQAQQDWQARVRREFGIDPESKAQTGAEFVGQNIGPGLVATAVNIGASAAMETVNPYLQKWGQSQPIPTLFPNKAHAATAFGAPPIVVNTPGGPVVMNDATLQGMVLGGVAALGFGMGLSQSGRVLRYARENPITRNVFDPTREVPGGGGVTSSSLPVDVLKAASVNPMQAIVDTVDRGARFQNRKNTMLGSLVGISKDAANEVYQRMRIQTRSGAENLAGQALVNGDLNTTDFHFKVQAPLSLIHMFSEKNREFAPYLRLRVIQDEIYANQVYNLGTPNAKGTGRNLPPEPRPETFTDHQNTHWTDRSVAAEIARLENANPKFKQAYSDYQANLAETRRFVTDGPNAPENVMLLTPKAMERRTLPIFSDKQNTQRMFDAILKGDNPLRFAENNMHKAIMRAMSHDADKRYVDFSMNEVPNSFREVDRDWIRNHGQVARAEGAILRRKHNGEYRYWVGDPFVVSVLNNGMGPITFGKSYVSKSKRMFESMTTGKFAPWFAPTALTRSVGQGFVTAPPISSTGRLGRPIAPAGPISTAVGFAANVTPRAVKKMAPTVKFFEDALKNTPLGQIIDPKYHNLLSRTMNNAYYNSFYHRMKVAGAFGPDSMNYLATETASHITRAQAQTNHPMARAVLDQLLYSDRMWAKFLRGVPSSVTHTLQAANKVKEAATEAGAYGWAYKAHGMGKGAKVNGRLISDAEMAAMMRDYTGDPMIKGNPWTTTEGGGSALLKFKGTPAQEARAKLATSAGVTMQTWRMFTPWAGVLVQSPAATLAALRDNPLRANTALVMSAVMPEIIAYMWNMANGQKVINYAMDERGEHRNTHSIYVYNPAYPDQPWKGWEIPMAQEFILPRAMARAVANQYMGRASDTINSQLWDALSMFLKGAVAPPLPPIVSGGAGLMNVATPEGYFNWKQKRENPFALTKTENPIELAWRNMMPSIADIGIAAWTAGWEGPSAPWKDFNPKTAAKGAGYRMQTRVPIIGSSGRLPVSSTKTDELFKYQREIEDLNARYNKWDKDSSIDPTKGRGTSAEGRIRTGKFVGPTPPTESWSQGKIPVEGVVPKTNNPLYDMFMKQMMVVYTSDSPDKGGIGYKSLWKNHDIYKKKLDAMDSTHAGNEALYVEKMKTKMPKTREYLQKNGIDPYNFREVRDFYANRVVQAQQRILETIQATEQKFNKDPRIRKLLKPGQEFKLRMLNPNKPGIDTGEAE